jgi:hypothetical protein
MILNSSKTEIVVCAANVVSPLKYAPNLPQNIEGVKYIVPKIYTGTTKLRRVSEAIDGRLGWGIGSASSQSTAANIGALSNDERKALIQQLLQSLN